ncbi:hypothetical protein E2C01_023017 [Portunus trituberculatus]|uniref:Uncharacterized protein n=1 Tax=Portunus trituberculatus TaxID=210409 RepID=A0A5B7E950_PORTR|nr:hypothetical protein [Portunus trituberculatus]
MQPTHPWGAGVRKPPIRLRSARGRRMGNLLTPAALSTQQSVVSIGGCVLPLGVVTWHLCKLAEFGGQVCWEAYQAKFELLAQGHTERPSTIYGEPRTSRASRRHPLPAPHSAQPLHAVLGPTHLH